MEGTRGRLLVAGALAAAVALIVAIAVLASGDSGGDLRVELAGTTDLVVYVEKADNEPGTAKGRRVVTLECVDRKGGVLVRGHHPWPFTDTDNGVTDAHVHQPLARSRASEVSRCELGGTRGPLRGELSGTGFE